MVILGPGSKKVRELGRMLPFTANFGEAGEELLRSRMSGGDLERK